MTLVLQLDPELEARLKSEAENEGQELAEYVQRLLHNARPPRKLKGYGMFKGLLSVEEFHEERQREKAREIEREKRRENRDWTTS